MTDFEFLIERIESLGLEVNILRDVNCNVAACPLESHTKNLLEICDLYQNHQLINVHTRITESSELVQVTDKLWRRVVNGLVQVTDKLWKRVVNGLVEVTDILWRRVVNGFGRACF